MPVVLVPGLRCTWRARPRDQSRRPDNIGPAELVLLQEPHGRARGGVTLAGDRRSEQRQHLDEPAADGCGRNRLCVHG